MRQVARSRVLMVLIGFFLLTPPLPSQAPKPLPLVIPLRCAGGDCPLLQGSPQTAGMRSGFVRLKPGETVGWHSTGQNEETLVVLAGKGATLIEGRSPEGQSQQAFTAPALAYIPPATRHNVQNTGTETLEYVYVVAPATSR